MLLLGADFITFCNQWQRNFSLWSFSVSSLQAGEALEQLAQKVLGEESSSRSGDSDVRLLTLIAQSCFPRCGWSQSSIPARTAAELHSSGLMPRLQD